MFLYTDYTSRLGVSVFDFYLYSTVFTIYGRTEMCLLTCTLKK